MDNAERHENRKQTIEKQKKRLEAELKEFGLLMREDVLKAFRRVQRENFVVPGQEKYAYLNEPLPLFEGQTISQPLTVISMTESLDVRAGQKVLEVGAGSGYQAAILREIVGSGGKVISVERIARLKEFAESNLRRAGYYNVLVVLWDGSKGYLQEAPYDRIIVTASAESIPRSLVDQLNKGGRMIIPVGEKMQLIEKKEDGTISKKFLGYYRFVPLIEWGEAKG